MIPGTHRVKLRPRAGRPLVLEGQEVARIPGTQGFEIGTTPLRIDRRRFDRRQSEFV